MAYVRQLICDRCKKSVPVNDIKYAPKGKDSMTALCSECRALLEKTTSKGKPTSPTQEKDKTAHKEFYLCTRCDYKFKFGPLETTKPKCPYCSKSDSIKKCNIFSAHSLIKDIDDDY